MSDRTHSPLWDAVFIPPQGLVRAAQCVVYTNSEASRRRSFLVFVLRALDIRELCDMRRTCENEVTSFPLG